MRPTDKKPNLKIIEIFAVPIATGLVVEALRELLLGGWDVNKPLIIGSATIVAVISIIWIILSAKKEKTPYNIKRLIYSTSLIISLSVVTIVITKAYDYYSILNNTIIIDPAYHHLGDKPLDFLEPPDPEGTEYAYSFFLENLSKRAYLSIIAKDVDQNLFQSGVIIGINNVDFTYLNVGFQDVPTIQEHVVGERQVTFPIPQGLLKAGMNTIQIRVVPDPYNGNIDDIQFRDLKIILK